jgi:hypothetical protein
MLEFFFEDKVKEYVKVFVGRLLEFYNHARKTDCTNQYNYLFHFCVQLCVHSLVTSSSNAEFSVPKFLLKTVLRLSSYHHIFVVKMVVVFSLLFLVLCGVQAVES